MKVSLFGLRIVFYRMATYSPIVYKVAYYTFMRVFMCLPYIRQFINVLRQNGSLTYYV